MRQFRVSKIHPHCLKPSTLLVVAAIAGATLLTSCTREPLTTASDTTTSQISTPAEVAPEVNPDADLEPAPNWQTDNHIHGIAVNPKNPDELYVGTHHGLVKRSASGEWLWASQGNDYMGLTGHPTDGDRLYASGHPPEGGNLGFANAWPQT